MLLEKNEMMHMAKKHSKASKIPPERRSGALRAYLSSYVARKQAKNRAKACP